jgi:hypothetical protein
MLAYYNIAFFLYRCEIWFLEVIIWSNKVKDGDKFVLMRFVMFIVCQILQWSNEEEEMGGSSRTHNLIKQNRRKEIIWEI